MYNRYVRSNDGGYTRQSQQDTDTSRPSAPPPPASAPDQQTAQPQQPIAEPKSVGSRKNADPLSLFSGLLDRFHLGDIDIGDLLLLLLLFHLFREDGDEELLIAIGLLLIL